LENKLKNILENEKDWARLNTPIEGISIIKLPAFKGNPTRLAVEINPVDELGRPTKMRGLILRGTEELETFKELLAQDKLTSLLQNIESICEKLEKKTKDAIEI
jgi:hypothetical protein